jgi:hypothetical protein
MTTKQDAAAVFQVGTPVVVLWYCVGIYGFGKRETRKKHQRCLTWTVPLVPSELLIPDHTQEAGNATPRLFLDALLGTAIVNGNCQLHQLFCPPRITQFEHKVL